MGLPFSLSLEENGGFLLVLRSAQGGVLKEVDEGEEEEVTETDGIRNGCKLAIYNH